MTGDLEFMAFLAVFLLIGMIFTFVYFRGILGTYAYRRQLKADAAVAAGTVGPSNPAPAPG
jgi:hypothetical protein